MLFFDCADIVTQRFHPLQGIKCPAVFRRLSEVAVGVPGRYPFPAGAEKLLYCPSGGAFGLTLPQHTLLLGHRRLETVKFTNFRLAKALAYKILTAACAGCFVIVFFHEHLPFFFHKRLTVYLLFPV